MTFVVGRPLKVEEENTWMQALSKVGPNSEAQITGSAIFLGDPNCGKTSLLQRLNKKRPSFSSALEYSFLNIRADLKKKREDDDAENKEDDLSSFDCPNLPVYLLNGETFFKPLLNFAFPRNLNKCCIVLMAPLLPVREILPSLEKWYNIAVEKIREVYDEEEIRAGMEAQLQFWQEYLEPLDETFRLKHHVALLPEHIVLTENCGSSVVVVLTKCDEFDHISEDNLSRVQYHVRNFCINRGAALIYTSAKDDTNIQILYKYLAHRVYGLPFNIPAHIIERDSIFIPTGWDSIEKLDIIRETFEDEEFVSQASVDTACEISADLKTAIEKSDEELFDESYDEDA